MSCSSREKPTRKRPGDLLGRHTAQGKARRLGWHRGELSSDGVWGDAWEMSSVDFVQHTVPFRLKTGVSKLQPHWAPLPTKPHSSQAC